MDFFSLQKQHESLDLVGAVSRVLNSGRYILGGEVEAFEREMSGVLGCQYVVGVSSGTDALIASLMALGVGRGDEVVTSPYTFFATVGAILRVGAEPVFVDIDPRTYSMDIAKVKITPKTKAMIPVHVFGRPYETKQLEVYRTLGIKVIGDCAQAIGAEEFGKSVASWGDVGCFSFFPSKNLGCCGDGGMVTTNDLELANRLRRIRSHGRTTKYCHVDLGGNFRLDEIQAAILRAKLPGLSGWTERRRKLARGYSVLSSVVKTPEMTPGHVFNQYVIRTERRDELMDYLKEKGIPTEIYWPIPCHLQPCMRGWVDGDFPNAEKAARESLALPIYPEFEEQDRVIEAIFSFFK